MKPTRKFLTITLLLIGMSDGSGQPAITRHPTGASVSLGASVRFTASATTTNPSLQFQWQFATANLAGQTNSSLTLTNIQLIHAGNYALVATDVSGSVTSRVAVLELDLAFTKLTTGPVVTDTGDSEGAAFVDFNGDGLLDINISCDDNANPLYRNDGNGVFTKITNSITTDGGRSTSASWTDFDNDGLLDHLVSKRTGGPALLFRQNPDGLFTRTSLAFGGYAFGAAWADYDNDGFLDLVMADTTRSVLWYNTGNGTLTAITNTGVSNTSASSITWVDYDNDGWLDMIVSDVRGGNRLYHNERNGTFRRIRSGSIANDKGNSTSAIWGDYDRDGFLDLFIANGIQGGGGDVRDYLYRNSGNANSWITIKCAGTVSNRSAVGTKVRVRAIIDGKTFWQLREISTGDGWSQNPLEAHFGLGDATNVETLRIEWPSGTIQEFQNLSAKQYLTATELARLPATSSNGVPQFSLRGGRRPQYDIQTSAHLSTWSLFRALTITNPDGTALIADTNPPASDRRFYRAVLR